ncbi:H-NS histone family protein [Burkholderia sp. 9775_39]|uniref:H-NS histone family protein n=1 Tax=unclassified Burkholderia TaxID=2613784 RepID=UPI0018C37BE2|nr:MULTISPECIES: H-NS histone family protein [unclassified Burkholderia]MBG0881926.1 H-NS histone family protein [Burkholderia sp. 9775_39]MBG0888853.1 H-NS histone family protein [Burkholderia sp. 9773_38]
MKNSTLHTLQLELQDLNTQLAKVKTAEKKAALAAFKEQVAQYGITQQEVLSALGYVQSKCKQTAAKYYDASSGKSWSGRGPRPKWLEGKDLNDYAIDHAPKPWWPGESV